MISPVWRKSVIAAAGFFGTLGILSLSYAALNGGLSASDKVSLPNTALSATAWNRIVDGVLDLDARTDGITSAGGNVGIGTASPSAKLHVNWPVIRTIAHATANGPNDDTDTGQIASRVLNFTKLSASTKIRISYTDTLRTYGTNTSCRWEIRVAGASCPTQPLIYDYYTSNDNTHRGRTVVGYCNGIAAGSRQIQVWVSSSPGYSGADCYTGWNASTWVLEAEEVN